VGVLVARYLGPAQLGMISYALNVVAIFTVASTLGMDSIVVREMVIRKEDTPALLGTTFGLRLAGAALVVILATAYSFMRDVPEQTAVVFLVSLSIMVQSLMVIDFYFQSKVMGKYTAMNQVYTLLLSAGAKLLLIYLHASVLVFSTMVLLESLLSMTFQLYFFSRNGMRISEWRFSRKEALTLLGYSWPVIISAFFQMIYQKADQVLILRFLRDISLVGQYSAAVRISEASYFIPVAITAAVFPGIISNLQNEELKLKRFTQLCSLLVWTAIAISLGGLLLGDWVIHFMYKSAYPLSATVFKIHVWGSLPIYYGTAWGMWMLAHNKQRIVIAFQLVNLLVYIISSFLLIPRLGINGAAYTSLATYYISLSCITFLYKPRESLRIMAGAFNPLNLLEIFKYLKGAK
jgi:O-antigen/teichoic acid export membrane protein